MARPAPIPSPNRASSRQTPGGNQSIRHQDLIKTVREYLQIRGAYELKVLGGMGQRAGVADLLACIAGRFIAVECKTGTATLTDKQRQEARRVQAAGGVFVEVRELEDLEDALLAAGLVESPTLFGFRRKVGG